MKPKIIKEHRDCMSDITNFFEISELQKLQDLFSEVHQVASIITYPDGRPITQTSNFCKLCGDIIRKTKKGSESCRKSDSIIGKSNKENVIIRKCLSAGLWDAGVGIKLGDRHIANWMIGQVRSEDFDEENILKYAKQIDVDEKLFVQAYREVPVMSETKFRKIVEMLNVYVDQLSNTIYNKFLLKEANRELREISNSLPEIIWKAEYDLKADTFSNTFISDVADETLKLPKGTIGDSFENFFSYIYSEYIKEIKDTLQKAYNNIGKNYLVKYKAKKGDNTSCWLESTVRANKNSDKINIYGTTKDISEFEKIKNKQKTFFEQGISLNLILDFNGNIQDANNSWCQLLGYKKNEIVGNSFFKLIHSGDFQKTVNEINRLKRGEAISYFENRCNHKQGECITIAWSAKADIYENIIYVTGYDISTQKQIKKDLAEEKNLVEKINERLELVMQVTLDGPWDWNLITNEIYFSDRWKAILGYAPHELPNDFSIWEKLTKSEDVKVSWERLNQHILGNIDKFEMEFQMQHKNGSWVDVLSRAHAIFNEKGEAVRVIGTHIDITLEKKNREKLIENEKRFRELIEHLPSGVAVYRAVDEGKDFEFLDFNTAAEQITNSKKEELVGKTLVENFPNMKETPLFKALVQVYKTDKEVHIPPFFYKDKQREGWRENSIYKLPNGEIVAIFKDVTELKVIQERLEKQNHKLQKAILVAEQNEQRFKVLHDASFGGIAIHDKGKIIECNSGLSKLTGYTHEELIGMDGLLLIDEEARGGVLHKIINKYERAYESVGIKKDGKKFPIRLEGRMIYYQGKEVRVVEFRDITEQKATEKREARFTQAIEQSSNCIILTDLDGVIEYVNPAFEKYTGYSSNEALGYKTSLLSSGYHDLKFYADLWNTLKEAKTWHGEFCNRKKNGDLYWESANISPVLDKSGKIINYLAIKEDISQTKKLISDLENAKEMAEKSEKLKSAFLANMSHEIRTPMNGILGFIDLLQYPDLSDSQKANYSEIIDQSGKRLLDTINDIIDYSKIEAGDIALHIEEFNLYEFFQYFEKFFALEANKKGIVLSFIPPNTNSIVIRTDKVKLNSILINLIKNAIKFTSKGQVNFGYQFIGNELMCYVKDTGIGIAKDKLESIFERFIQADISISRGHEGAGLGLAICKGYVEKMGGKIWVESKADMGSLFRFTIKLEDEQNKELILNNKLIQSDEIKQENLSSQEKFLVMIAEDDENSYRYLSVLLKRRGCEVVRALNGEEAVNIYFENPNISFIFMDLKMPKMDGFEATKQIRAANSNIPIVAQTAFAQLSDRVKALDAGCTDYISKPIVKEKLNEILTKYLIN